MWIDTLIDDVWIDKANSLSYRQTDIYTYAHQQTSPVLFPGPPCLRACSPWTLPLPVPHTYCPAQMARSLHWTHEGSPGDMKLPVASEFPALGSPSGVQQARLWVAGLRRRPSCRHPRPWASGSASPPHRPSHPRPRPPTWLLIQVWTPWAPASNVQQTFFQFPITRPAKLQICEKGYKQWKKKPLPV